MAFLAGNLALQSRIISAMRSISMGPSRERTAGSVGQRIGISGAGIGGAAFALALEQACKARGISPMPVIKIFERDESPSAREDLGYSFTLDSEGNNGGLTVRRASINSGQRVSCPCAGWRKTTPRLLAGSAPLGKRHFG